MIKTRTITVKSIENEEIIKAIIMMKIVKARVIMTKSLKKWW